MTVLAPPAPTQPQPFDARSDGDDALTIADRPRVLFPFAGPFDPSALDVAVGLSRSDGATLTAVYLTVVPLGYRENAPEHEPSWLAAPLLDVVERAALDEGVTVCTRIGTGRTLRHGLGRLLEDERFSSIVAPAPTEGQRGFAESDLAWLVAHAPTPTIVLKPGHPAPSIRPEDTTAAAYPHGFSRSRWSEAIVGALGTKPTI